VEPGRAELADGMGAELARWLDAFGPGAQLVLGPKRVWCDLCGGIIPADESFWLFGPRSDDDETDMPDDAPVMAHAVCPPRWTPTVIEGGGEAVQLRLPLDAPPNDSATHHQEIHDEERGFSSGWSRRIITTHRAGVVVPAVRRRGPQGQTCLQAPCRDGRADIGRHTGGAPV
jgi:hypothetical protein